MIKGLFSQYSRKFPSYIAYMLQSTEYEIVPYLKWYWRTTDFDTINYRRDLVLTKTSSAILKLLKFIILAQITLGLLIFILGYQSTYLALSLTGLVLVFTYPLIASHLIVLPVILAKKFIIAPNEQKLIAQSKTIFESHPAERIAVAGSFGKTTVKEILLTVLSAGKKVAATPANKNVAVSHAAFAKKLEGDEEIIVVEFGEGQPGDVKKFSQTVKPTYGVITGIAPAHLDKYKTLKAAAEDIFSLADFVPQDKLLVNLDSEILIKHTSKKFNGYSQHDCLGWKVSQIDLDVSGMKFTAKKGSQTLQLQTKLVGKHLIGPLILAVGLADKLGLNSKQIIEGVSNTKPFEHRMQPYLLAGGWIIDDTYNGNLEGIKAGLALLSDLQAKRKIYVTPGLVDQGEENEPVHLEIGKLIAKANPTKVVLMENSVTHWIQQGLKANSYKGEVVIESQPLNFYQNLEHFVAAGDVVLMQNDWTDNYN